MTLAKREYTGPAMFFLLDSEMGFAAEPEPHLPGSPRVLQFLSTAESELAKCAWNGSEDLLKISLKYLIQSFVYGFRTELVIEFALQYRDEFIHISGLRQGNLRKRITKSRVDTLRKSQPETASCTIFQQIINQPGNISLILRNLLQMWQTIEKSAVQNNGSFLFPAMQDSSLVE